MTERPILFNGDMVRAILAGRKTETRRPLKYQPCGSWGTYRTNNVGRLHAQVCEVPDIDRLTSPSPRWHNMAAPAAEGDRLWVRETYAKMYHCPPDCSGWESDEDCDHLGYEYRADLPADCTDFPGEWPRELAGDPCCPKWTPSIHMPREACRLTIPVVEARVERLQSIDSLGVKAEGVRCPKHGFCLGPCLVRDEHWARLWNSIYGKRPGLSWEANPWVWVVRWGKAEVRP